MSVKRYILRFFAIISFVLGVQNVASATIAGCSSSGFASYTPYNSYQCSSAGADPTAQTSSVETCFSCQSGYEKQLVRSYASYACGPGSCVGAGAPDESECDISYQKEYTCVKSGSGDSGGDSGTGTSCNVSLDEWAENHGSESWVDASSERTEYQPIERVIYDNPGGNGDGYCSFVMTKNNIIKDDFGYFTGPIADGESMQCWYMSNYVCPSFNSDATYTDCHEKYYLKDNTDYGMTSYKYSGIPNTGTKCAACPTGAHCPGGTFSPTYKVNFFNLSDVGYSVKYNGTDIHDRLYIAYDEIKDNVEWYYLAPSNVFTKLSLEDIKIAKTYHTTKAVEFLKEDGTLISIYGTTFVDGTEDNLLYYIKDDNTIDVVAELTVNTYKITLDQNGGTGGYNEVYEIYGSKWTYGGTDITQVQIPTKANNVFTGYWDTPAGGDVHIDAAGTLPTPAYFNSDATLYAGWSACTCTTGTGVSSCTVKSVSNNQCQYSSGCKTGYNGGGTFSGTAGVGTNTASNCSANTYDVAYNPNGGSGSMSNSSHTYDTAKNLTANTFTRTGYAFTGWNTKADGSGTSYINGASVKNLTTTNSGTVNLYAQWTANTITLTFANGGRGTAPTTPTSCTYDSTFTMPPAMTATGYTFDKWSVNNNTFSAGASVICNNTNLGVTSGAATIKGTWTANTYTITLNDSTNGGSGGNGTIKEVYENKWTNSSGTTISSVTVPTKSNSVFTGYYTASSSGTSYITNTGGLPLNTTFTSDTTLYAQFASCSCTKGTNVKNCTVTSVSNNQCKYSYVCNDGYSSTTSTFTGAAATATNTSPSCTANTITLTFANGGRGTAPTTPTSCTYDSTFTMPPAMTATGYTFDKWSVNNNTFSAGASVICNNTNLGVTSGAATIKGTWTAKITTINLDSSHNGTSVNTNATPTTIYSKYDSGYFKDSLATITISKLTNIPVYNKYVFKGFYDGSTQIINQEGNIVAAQNFYADTITKTINAKYEKCTCNLGQNVKSCDVTGTSNNTCEYNYTCEDGYIITDSALINGVFEGTKNNSSHTSPNCTPRCNKITLNNTANGGTGGTTAIYTKTGSGVYYSDAACTAGNEIAKSNELAKPTKTNASFNGYYDALTGGTQCTEYARGMWKNCSVNGDTTWYARYNCTQYWLGSGITILGECTRSIYKVNFDKNHTDATGTMEVQSVESGVATKLNANKFVRTGYTFSGWNTAADGSGYQYTDQAEINRNATHNSELPLYAQWTTEEYAITYYDGDTKLTNLEPNNYKTTSETFDLPTPTKTGYTFVHWYENPELSGEPVTKVTKGSTGDKTFWAKWIANRYKVTYACGTTNATPPSATEATYDQKFTMATNTCVRPGYKFSHWLSTNNDRYSAGSFYTWKFTNDKTFIAQWTAVTYTITYNPNGGSAVADNTYTVEATFELPTTTRDGYTFAGWYDNAELSGEPVTEVTKGSTGDKTFWAKWTANKITINYYIDGKSVPGDYSCTYDQSFNILEYTDNELLPAGYDKITQWIDNVHQNQYTPNDLVLCNENDIGVSSGAIDLHANLQKGKYKITLDGNGGTGGTTMLYTRYEDGVYLDAERTHEMTADNNPITIPEKQYTVTYNANGGSCSQNEDIVTYIFKEYTNRTQYHPSAPVWINDTGYITEHGHSKSIASTEDIKLYAYYSANSTTLPTPTRDGYTFSGWTNAETDGVRIGGAGDSYTPTDNITLYAQWTEEEYTITYNLPESAENNSSNPSTYTVNDDVTLYDPSYYGYDFDGWYENEQQITNIPKGSTGNKILTSKWNPKLLKVFVQKSNGDIDSNKQLSNCVYGKEYSIPKNQFGQTGYEFIGWTCTGPTVCNTLGILPADGNLESLMDWAQITSGDSITLIANWEPSKYSVTYDCGDGSTGTAPSKEEAKYNELFTVAKNTCERTGYTFIKWETFNDNGVKQGLLAGDQFNWEYLKDKTLTAYWEPNTIAIHYYNNGTLVHTDTCTYDETFISYLGNAPEGYQYLDGIWHLEFEGKKLFHGAAYNCDYETLGVASGEISAGEELIPNKYRIHFYANDGTNTVTYQDRTYDDNKQLNKNQFTRTGYTFISWNTQINGKGVTYEDMQYGNITSNSDEIVALYAQWEANPITCLKGYYLPAQTVTCIICESDSYCDGGTFIIQQKSQGIKLCPYGQKSPAGSTNISQCYADAQECFIEHATMAHRHWDYDKNAYGKCIAEECEAEYHLEANACVSDKQPCSTQNGTGIKIWNSTTLQYGNCTETECKPGYTISSEQCVPCDNMYVDNEIAVSTYSNECEIATCMYQGEKYILDNNECVPICETVTDKSGSRHWDKNSKRCVHECNAGWTKW